MQDQPGATERSELSTGTERPLHRRANQNVRQVAKTGQNPYQARQITKAGNALRIALPRGNLGSLAWLH